MSKSGNTSGGRQRVFTPTPEAKGQATRNRVIAFGLWIAAIVLQLVAIFWVMRPSFEEQVEAQGFPEWRFYLLLGFVVVIGALAIGGNLLWKKSNRLDPASEREPVKFFIQNQLGAFMTLLAFLPLIVMIFLNKDMDKKQKGIAGGAAVVVALVATVIGIDFTPLSQEQAAVESQVVTQLVGEDRVWWSGGGNVMHLCEGVSDLRNVTTGISSGTVAEAFAAGKTGITLNLSQNLSQCELDVPANLDEIIAWVRASRGR